MESCSVLSEYYQACVLLVNAPAAMSSNAAISNLSSQNIAAGGGDQLNQNGNGTQINNSTFYGGKTI